MKASFSVVVNVFQDEQLLPRLMAQLAQHCPAAPQRFIPDTDRLKLQQSGVWTQRYLEAALQDNCDFILKLDPDTCIWRAFDLLDADWYGTISNNRQWIRGGASMLSREAAEIIVKTRLLLVPNPASYPRYSFFRWPHEQEDFRPVSLQDKILGEVARKLKISPVDWSEAYVLGNDMVEPEPRHFAITHPHPFVSSNKNPDMKVLLAGATSTHSAEHEPAICCRNRTRRTP